MKLLHFNTYQRFGGAAIAAYRLHKSLIDFGIESSFITRHRASDDQTVVTPQNFSTKILSILQPQLDNLPLFFYPKKEKNEYFSTAWSSSISSNWINSSKVDLIHLHWIGDGFLSIESLTKIKKPIVWTLHDSWAFTGGCHVPYECKGYRYQCGKCPILSSKISNDLSAKILAQKKKLWKDLNLTIVTPSRWLAECAGSSTLFRGKNIHVIPNGIDSDLFKPVDKIVVRKFLSFPTEKQLIMIGAVGINSVKNKGFSLFEEALQYLFEMIPKDQIELVIFGMSPPLKKQNTGITTHYIGHLHDEISMALVYSAADILVVPSIQESFGLTAMEALSCGVPVVAFNTTGLKDIIEHKKTGYLAQPFDTKDLAAGISWLLNDINNNKLLSLNSRKRVNDYFTSNKILKQYIQLYDQIIK